MCYSFISSAGSLQAITNPEQETVSYFEDVSTLQGRHGHHTTEPAEPTQLPHPHVKAHSSASLPILSQQQTRQVPERYLSDPSGKQSAEFYISGDTMPAIHEQQTGNTNQGNFTTSSNQGVISSQQRGQPSGATPYSQQYGQPRTQSMIAQGEKEFVDGSLTGADRMLGVNKPLTTNPDFPTSTRGIFFPNRGRARGRRSRVKYINSQLPRPGSNQGAPPSHPPMGQGSRTTSGEQSQASKPIAYNSEGFGRNSTTSTSSAASIPVSTTLIGIVTAKFDQIRVNQAPPNDTTAQQPAVYTALPPPQEQSQTLSESLTSFMCADSITESSLNSSTCSEPRLDDELPPTMYLPKTKSRLFMFHVAPYASNL